MRPDISIVIQTYNHAPFIRECLQSVVDQETDYRIEILVGEDGSTDGTAKIVDDFACLHPDIVRVFHRDRGDVIYAMGRPTGRSNLLKTIASASGRYLAILDGDDFYTDPRKLELQGRMLDADPTLSACCHALLSVDEAGHVKGSEWTRPTLPMEYAIDIAAGRHSHVATFLSRNNFGVVPHWFRELPYADWPLLVLRAGTGRIGYLAGTFTAYRVHPGGMYSGATRIRRVEASRRTAAVFRRNWPDKAVAQAAVDREFRALLRLAPRRRAAGQHRASRMALARAWAIIEGKEYRPSGKQWVRFLAEGAKQRFWYGPFPTVQSHKQKNFRREDRS